MKTISLLVAALCFAGPSVELFAIQPPPSAEALSRTILDRKLSNAERLAAAIEAGRHKLPECIPALISEIDQVQTDRIVNELQPLGVCYPCAGALIMIGSPSIAPVKQASQKSGSPLRANLLREVLFCLEGEGARTSVESYFESFTPAPAKSGLELMIPSTLIQKPISNNYNQSLLPPAASTSRATDKDRTAHPFTSSSVNESGSTWTIPLLIILLTALALPILFYLRRRKV